MQTANHHPGPLTAVTPAQPAVSVVLPFEPHLRSKAELEILFQTCVSKVIARIDEEYDTELGRLVIGRLKKIFTQLNFSSFKKSVAIFISPVFEKIIYIPFAVEPRVFVSHAFNIQHVVKARIENSSFLLVNLSRYASNIYVSDGHTINRVNMNMRNNSSQVPVFPKGAAFTDRNELREILLRSFLHRTDQALQLLLKAYPLPVVITGSPKVIGEFRKISVNSNKIVKYINGYFTNADERSLKEVVNTVLNEWQQVQEKHLHQRLEAAANAGHLAIGIREVWRHANTRNASLLVVEDNYVPAAILPSVKADASYDNYSLIHNTIDDVVEKVLEAGGDIQFVKPGTLAGFDPVVLIERYSSTLQRKP